jgi:acyl-CoA synthetase (AMP-forming)/AMP-acid ligase II
MPLIGRPLEAPVRVQHLLRTGLDQAPDGIALASTTMRCTWRDLEGASDNLAANLLDLGLGPGDRVASLMPNRVALLIHYMACLKTGVVAVPLNYRYTIPEIDRALAVSEASILLAHAEREGELADSRRVLELPRGLIIHEDEKKRRQSLSDLIAMAPVKSELPVSKADDPAFIFFTSGSTGPAKGVTYSSEAIGWMLATAAAALELVPGDVVLPGGSLSHNVSFVHSLAALAVGARVVIPQAVDGQEILRLLREQRPTVLFTQPTVLFRLIRDHGARREDFASLRLCRTGSDKTPAQLAREFTELTGMAIHEGFGMTETGVVAMNPPSGVNKVGSIGPAAPGVCISIRDEGGQELPAGMEGHLWISTPSLTMGYWRDPAATAAVIRDGWLDSGDIMKADDDGYLTFCGRKKQLIVHDGSNISPQEVEDALLQHAAVALAGVVGVRDLVHGENVRAYVTLKPGARKPSPSELIQFARAQVGYKAPEEVEFLAEMPLNAGKVDRAALKRLAATGDTTQDR